MVLGAAYKPDIDDLRESPSLDVIGLLMGKGATVQYHDPFIPRLDHENIHLTSVSDLMESVRKADCVVVITNHSQYDYRAILDQVQLVVDTRNAFGKIDKTNPKIVRL